MTDPKYIDRAMDFAHDDGFLRTHALAAELESHSARVTDLLDANNRYLERARLAERELDAINKQFAATARVLAEVARERDELKAAATSAHMHLLASAPYAERIYSAVTTLSGVLRK